MDLGLAFQKFETRHKSATEPRPAERLKNGSAAVSGDLDCTACANGEGDYDIKPWPKHRVVACWVGGAVVSWAVVYGVGRAIYEAFAWALQ